MSEKPRLLYLMHVDWDWIKQRPHFLAEELASYFDVDVFYGKSFHKVRNLTKNPVRVGLSPKALVRLPIPLCRHGLIKAAAGAVNRHIVGRAIRAYDIVWFCHPIYFDDFEGVLSSGQKVVYDCMDDALEFPNIKNAPRVYRYVEALERRLLERADLVVFSSRHLQDQVQARTRFQTPALLANNGANPDALGRPGALSEEISQRMNLMGRKITYIGTVSEWIDFDLILASLEEFKDISYCLFGPVGSGVQIPFHPRIHAFGPIPHDQILQAMETSDLLIMPFKENELIRSVDPVKLYEYIYSGKPTLALGYPETEKFKEFVYLYWDSSDYSAILAALSQGGLRPKRTVAECQDFVTANSWSERVQRIRTALL